MEENKLYDIDSVEFRELIDSARVNLQSNNDEYKKLMNKIYEIKANFPSLKSLIENDKVTNLNEEECKMLQKFLRLYMEISNFEDREIFFLCARENYFYMQNLNLIKEK